MNDMTLKSAFKEASRNGANEHERGWAQREAENSPAPHLSVHEA